MDHHNFDIILTLFASLSLALVFGFITQKLKLSPIVGYLLAGIVLGPYTPGIVANTDISMQFAEIGIILLMFGVGLHFHLKDLVAVQKIAIPGAIIQIAITTLVGMIAVTAFGWEWNAGFLFGIAISVASTVVLIRVLSDNDNLHTRVGHVAVGWLIVEDLFTIFILVLLPEIFSNTVNSENTLWMTFGIVILKLIALVLFTLIAGQKLIPLILGYVARTKNRDLFTLAILTLALGVAVIAAEFFNASFALGAFLAGMIVGQSDFSARAASEAFPMRDTFAVLFFVAVGMMFTPSSFTHNWQLILVTLAIVMIVKPLSAITVVLILRRQVQKAVYIGVALAQIGEFSFILAVLGNRLGVLPAEASSIIIAASVLSITLNPLLYRSVDPFLRWLFKHGIKCTYSNQEYEPSKLEECNNVIVVGYNFVGRNIARILINKGVKVKVIELNIDAIKQINEKSKEGFLAIHGDASQLEILLQAGIEKADAIIISATGAPASNIVKLVRSINSKISILIHTTDIENVKELRAVGADVIFSAEGSGAQNLSNFLLNKFGAIEELGANNDVFFEEQD